MMKKCFALFQIIFVASITACSNGSIETSQNNRKELPVDSAAIKIDLYAKEACGATKPTIELLKAVIGQMDVTSELNIVMLKSNSEANEHKVIGVPTIRVNGIDIDPIANQIHKYGIT